MEAALIHVPSPTAPVPVLWEFALIYNAYDRHGGFDGAADIGNRCAQSWRKAGEVPADLDVTRAALFFEQRRNRHVSDAHSAALESYVRALLARIADLSGGTIAGPADALP